VKLEDSVGWSVSQRSCHEKWSL